MTIPAPMTVADIPDTWAECETIRQQRIAWRRAKPVVRVWTNPADGSEDDGLQLVGIATDNIAGNFPSKNKVTDPGTGVLRLRPDHPIAQAIINVPLLARANPSLTSVMKANFIITVDHMGRAYRWSGLARNWKLRKDSNGVRYIEITFIEDTQFLQFILCPPNPVLPIDVFQWPRDLPFFGPSKWCISVIILLQLIRLNGNLWNIPEDPFDLESWIGLIDWTSWQVFIDANPFDLDDSTLWDFFAMRMDRCDQVIADAMDDAQLTMQYRRILTVDGESYSTLGGNCRNGALVFTVVDNSGYYTSAGTGTIGSLADGLLRTVVSFAEGGVEDIITVTSNDDAIQPDEYYTAGYYGTMPSNPWVMVLDGPYTSIETSELTWSPDTAVSAIVGGDNPLADQLAQLTIESIGDLLSWLLTGGFYSGAGEIASTVIMPFLVGTIAAWLQYTNNSRAEAAGWVHLYEIFGQGANNNAWSLSAIDAFRAAFDQTASETSHTFTMGGSDRYLPGLDFVVGNRIGSTDLMIGNLAFADQVAQMTLAWDYSQNRPHDYEIQVGEAKAKLTQAERTARMLAKMNSTIADIGVHLIS